MGAIAAKLDNEGNFTVDNGKMTVEFNYSDGSQSLFCRTTGVTFYSVDGFGDQRFTDEESAAAWAIENIEKILDNN